MFTFSMNDKNYKVFFQYERETIRHANGNVQAHPFSTFCIIKEMKGDSYELVSSGNAKCSPEDGFIKAQGRKIALQRAIFNAKVFTKEQEGVILDKYKRIRNRRKRKVSV